LVGKCEFGVHTECTASSQTDFDDLLNSDEFKVDLILHIQELNLETGDITIKKIDYQMFFDPSIV
jgi:hypothetical protein